MSDFESHHAQIVGPGMRHPRLSPRVSRCAANVLSRLGADPRRDAKAWPQLRFRLRIGDETDAVEAGLLRGAHDLDHPAIRHRLISAQLHLRLRVLFGRLGQPLSDCVH